MARILKELWQQAVLVTASSLLFAAITIYTYATPWAQAASDAHQSLTPWLRSDVGTTLLAVRILQGLLTAIASSAVSSAFVHLHWRETHKPRGIHLVNLMALSPTTPLLGSCHIMVSNHAKLPSRLAALARLSLTALPWLAGILLFARTSLVTVFDTASMYSVTAGIGPFNASYVSGFVDSLKVPPYTVIPYSFSSVVHNLIANPLYSTLSDPIRCQPSDRNLDCASYVLSGGLSMTAPWTPAGDPDFPLVRISSVPAVQVEFRGRSGQHDFSPSDCLTFGSNATLIAAELCLSVVGGSMHAGLFICNGTTPTTGQCRAQSPWPNITTDVSFFRRRATVLAARSNLTITALSDLTPPQPTPISDSDIAAYRLALSWLLDYSAAGIPPPSAIIEIFWSNRNSLGDDFGDGVLLQNFRSILAFPVWLFNANNYGNTQVKGKVLNQGLPPEFYAQAAVVAPHVKLRFDATLLVVFICLEGVALLFLWGSLLYLGLTGCSDSAPEVSSFPIFDFFFKTHPTVIHAVDGSGTLERAGAVRVYSKNSRQEQSGVQYAQEYGSQKE